MRTKTSKEIVVLPYLVAGYPWHSQVSMDYDGYEK
jgi:hypothetical protein